MRTKKISVGNSIRVGTKVTPVVPIDSLINLSAQCPVEIKDLKYEVRCSVDVHRLIESVACKLDTQVKSYISIIMATVSVVLAEALDEKLPVTKLDFSLVIGDLLTMLRIRFDIFGPVITMVTASSKA